MKKEQQINSSSVISKMGSTTKMIQKLHKIAFKPHIQSVMNLFKLKLFYRPAMFLMIHFKECFYLYKRVRIKGKRPHKKNNLSTKKALNL
jgi:hypothetical protein